MISTKKYVFTIVLAVILIAGSFLGGLHLGNKGYVFQPSGFKITNENGAPSNVDYSLLWNAMTDLQQNYINWSSVNQQSLLYGAVNGMVNAVGDPHTEFFDPTDLAAFNSELSGTFDGIGAQVGLAADGNVEIVSPLAGTPAQQAGLKTGDEILSINGTSAAGITLDNAVTAIRGPKGTQVKLSIYRPSTQATLNFTITRATIDVPSVTYSLKIDGTKKVEYIAIGTFGTDTDTLFAQAAAQATSNNVSGIILDLRGDGGGYLDDAVAVSSYWVTPGQTVVTEQHNAANSDLTKSYPATGGNTLAKIPTIILVDAGTASASEITSGALRDYGFAKLVGVQTYGKGSVQQLFDLQGGSAIKITIAKWLTPKGVNIDGHGLVPDYVVPLTTANTANGADPQLQKALDLLR